MKLANGSVVLSPSDLNVYFESPFASWMDRLVLHHGECGPGPKPAPDPRPAEMALLAAKGEEHERAYLERLRAEGHDVWVAPDTRDFDAKARATRAAMREGRGVLYQAALEHGGFAGHADFLVRVDEPSPEYGRYRYEVVDTKLARKPKPYFLLQLSAYAEMLEHLQGVRPRHVHIVNGEGERIAFRTDDYFFYYLTLKKELVGQVASFDAEKPPLPHPRADHGRWQSHADEILEKADHLARVAGITMNQIGRLEEAGVRTMKELARTKLDRVPHVDRAVFERLREQARLQVASAGLERPEFEIVVEAASDAAAPRGLAALPPASPMDVFFDMEGYPYAAGGLEYLFGSMIVEDGERSFVDFWAHDRAEEKRAFEAFIDWAFARFERDPSMHVYHYAAYEVAAMRRLASMHGTREERLDVLLRAEVFVDLYRIVRQGVRIGEPRYSLKNVEHLYRPKRSGDVSTAGQSVTEYARWLETRDGADWKASAILAGIRAYNLDDCESTLQLTEWLREQQAKHAIRYVPKAKHEEQADTFVQRDDELVAARMLAVVPEDTSGDPERWRVHVLLAHLVTFHRREDKPFWWNVFDKQSATDEELREDPECLGDLVRTETPVAKDKKSFLLEYSFDPAQETKVEAGSSCFVVGPAERTTVTVHALDLDTGVATLRIGPTHPGLPRRLSLIPIDRVSADKIKASIRRTAEAWEKTRALSPALRTLLHRELPQISGHASGAPLLAEGEDLTDGTVRVVCAMNATTLAIQGPPGAGKTTAASQAIVALVAKGKRVGIASNSHKAVDKLMEEAISVAKRRRVRLRAAKVKRDEPDEIVTVHGAVQAESMAQVEHDGAERAMVVGGTAWAFSDPAAAGRFDYLFVDEAGQVSLANLVGMAPSAENLVLLGDQMQLSQPTQGSHPGQSGLSALDYLLEGQTTVRPEQGIFLAKTWRLHPSLCSFISGAFYEDRLTPEPCTGRRLIRAPIKAADAAEAGLRFVPTPHDDNTQSSEEEAAAIEAVVADLLRRDLVLDDGKTRRMTPDDILVVAPYNLQVRLLRKRLPRLRIASVDKFQGQQAAAMVLSMCSSDGGASGRGMEFLFSPNRLNVAISRAQCLSVVVGSPALASTRPRSVREMKLVNLFARIVLESATR